MTNGKLEIAKRNRRYRYLDPRIIRFLGANTDNRILQKPKMRDLHRVSAMAAVIISVFLMLEIPLMVITIIHALKPQVRVK